MLVYAVAAVRCALVQRPVDFGALFALWVAVAADHDADAYWAATCSAVLLTEFVFPVALSLVGTAAVAAHSIVGAHFDWKHGGGIAVALLSLTHLANRDWLAQLRKKVKLG